MRLVPLLLLLWVAATSTGAQLPSPWPSASLAAARQNSGGGAARRLTTVDALRQFSGFYHLQNVVLRGELAESDRRIVLRSDLHEMRVVLGNGVRRIDGPVEVRAQLVDVGRLEPGDPRAAREVRIAPAPGTSEGAERWPRPGEELLLHLTNVTQAQPATAPSVRALAVEPWKYDGQRVTVTGNFRGRNLFGDLPGAPARSRYDFVLRGAEGAIWITGLRPRGRGFDLDVDRRVDSDRWVEVIGQVTQERGLVLVEATAIAIASAPEITEVVEESDAPDVPLVPVEVVFSSPTQGEADVSPTAPIRIQFSRGLDEGSLPGRIRVSYVGASIAPPDAPAPETTFVLRYDGANRAIELRLSEPMQPFRTLRVEVLDGLEGFDRAPVTPFTLTFTVGG